MGAEMEAKHTPGPWIWSEGQNGRLCFDDKAHFSSWTVLLVSEPKWRPSEPDARLIAASPDLLGAAVEADGCFEAALAEGWTDALADGDIERIRDLWDRRISHARHPLAAAIAKATGEPS